MSPERQQEFEESLELLRGRFEELNQEIKRPHSLDADVLRCKLESLELAGEAPRKNVVHWRAWASAAACFVFVFGAFFLLRGVAGNSTAMEAPQAAAYAAPMPEEAAAGEAVAGEAADEATPEAGVPAPAMAPESAGAAVPDAPEAPAAGGLKRAPEPDSGNDAGAPEGRSAKTDHNDREEAAAMPRAAVATAESSGSLYASSYTQLRDTVYTLAASPAIASYSMEADGEEAGMDAAPAASAKSASAFSAPAYSGTNLQEQGVDEADVVKTDGEYLYSYVYKNSTSKGPAIYIADAGELALTARIDLDEQVEEFYVEGDRLVTVGRDYDGIPLTAVPDRTVVEATDRSLVKASGSSEADAALTCGVSDAGAVEAVLYDISDRENPKLVKTFRQDGNYVSSRLMDGVLYLASSRYIAPDLEREDTPLHALVPAVQDGAEASARLLSPDRIAIAPGCGSASYAVVSTLELATGGSDTQAVLGGSDGVYMSRENLYVYGGSYRPEAKGGESYETTSILRFSVDGSRLALRASGIVDGFVDGQFAFSERDGNLRVAATASLPDGSTSNNLYVLGPGLKPVGALTGLAPGERIYAVRYLDEVAYLVTFRQTDPLFAVDLSDPARPRLLGQLKIPGFSEYLHPLKDGLLLGVGQSADQNGVTDGLKLSLFDISDPTAPKELHVYNFGSGSYSDALQNHKAVLFDEQNGLFGLPVLTRDASSKERAYDVFSWDREKGFTLLARVNHTDLSVVSQFGTVERGLTIGGTLYTFSPDWIVSYSLEDYQRKGKVQLC